MEERARAMLLELSLFVDFPLSSMEQEHRATVALGLQQWLCYCLVFWERISSSSDPMGNPGVLHRIEGWLKNGSHRGNDPCVRDSPGYNLKLWDAVPP